MRADVSGTARRYTWDEYLALADDDRRELIDGSLVEVSVPTKLHEHIVVLLAYFLVGWARLHGGAVLGSGYKVRVGERRAVMPDLQYFTPDHVRSLPEQGLSDGRPDLAVEVVSESSRRHDRVVKARWYADIGVPEYWIVDPDERTVERLVLRDERLVVVETHRADAHFTPATFPGLDVPLAELWTLPA
ncbi:MAG TPA: Uma2 family endonuclease [Candidatus Binatia bacterium]|jgi:Uma2 family endonuclease|nr:Uma2 family endonuclease [Candidatus Binatia bacterium]